ncbi:MAG: acetylxylan esterase [Armatimonadota bacterium]|nr:acetylxylan esterase [Armatimonadota bacterium]
MAYEIPNDFDAFWNQTKAEADGVTLNFDRRPTAFQPLDSHRIELLEFQGANALLQGWIALPHGADAKAPGFLWIPAYGRESHLPDAYSTREGFASISFNFHGHAAFHKEEYKRERGYFAEGVTDPGTWIFRRMAQDCFIAMRVLQAQFEVDEDDLSVAGLSQGGGIAIWTGSRSAIPKKVVADLPFLSDMGSTLGKDVYRYPLKELTDYAATIPLGMERVMHTVSYFDTAHHAARLRLPTLISLGEKDPAVRPETVRKVFANLAAKDKRLIEYPAGHDWHPDMIKANRDFLLTEVDKPAIY